MGYCNKKWKKKNRKSYPGPLMNRWGISRFYPFPQPEIFQYPSSPPKNTSASWATSPYGFRENESWVPNRVQMSIAETLMICFPGTCSGCSGCSTPRINESNEGSLYCRCEKDWLKVDKVLPEGVLTATSAKWCSR